MSKGIFKTSFMGGFRKNDVLNYINDAEKQSRENEEKLKGELASCKKSLEGLEGLKTQQETAARTLTRSLEEANARIAALTDEKKALESQLSGRETELLQKGSEIDGLSHEKLLAEQKAERLSQALSEKDAAIEKLQLSNETLSRTMGEMGKTEKQIANVMLEARKSADAMLSGAKEESAALLRESFEKMQALSGRASDFEGEILVLKDKLRYFYDLTDGMLERLGSESERLARQFKAPDGERDEKESGDSAAGPSFDFSSEKGPAKSECASTADHESAPE